jgi:hypothetical protein
MNADELKKLYDKHSISEIAKILKKSRATVYRMLIKHGISLRDKSEAQKKIDKHQRIGKKHSEESKENISISCGLHWEKNKKTGSSGSLKNILAMNSSPRPKNGELSKLGMLLFKFINNKEPAKAGIRLTNSRASDIILVNKKLVVELSMPFDVFDIQERYRKIIEELNGLGYKVLVVQQESNSVSNARCRRIYSEAINLFESDNKSKIIKV